MRPFLALLGKELQGFFKLPLVYFVAAVFLALSGYYTLMAMVLNTAGMPLPDNAAPPLKTL